MRLRPLCIRLLRGRARRRMSAMLAIAVTGLVASLGVPPALSAGATEAALADSLHKVSVGLGGQSVSGRSDGGSASDDGRWVVFTSEASDYGASTDEQALVLADAATGTAETIITAPAGSGGVTGYTISPDGSSIAYVVYNQETSTRQLTVSDRQTRLSRVLVDRDVIANSRLLFSADGRYLLFETTNPEIIVQPYSQVARYDLQARTYDVVSRNNSGDLAVWYAHPEHLSSDGRYAYFTTDSPNMPDAQSEGSGFRTFRRDMQDGITTEITRTAPWWNGQLSPNGKYLAEAADDSLVIINQESGERRTINLPSGLLPWCQEFGTQTYVNNDASRVYINTCQGDPYTLGLLWRVDVNSGAVERVAGPGLEVVVPFGDLAGAVLTAPDSVVGGETDGHSDVYVVAEQAITPPPPPVIDPCGDAAVIGVRGSGVDNDGSSRNSPGQRARDIARLLRNKWDLNLYDFQADGDGVIGLEYPAVGVPFRAAQYNWSRGIGVRNLVAVISGIRRSCGDLPILLAGYSQGAHVIQDALAELSQRERHGDPTSASIAGVALFGSPRFDPREAGARGTFVADALRVRGDRPPGGLLGAHKVPTDFQFRTRTYCVAHDAICQRGESSVNAHKFGYNAAPLLADAAGFLASQLLDEQRPAIMDSGRLRAYQTGSSGATGWYALSAAELYSAGNPTVRFGWDFGNDGRIDTWTDQAWVDHRYRFSATAKRAVSVVRVVYADGTHDDIGLCLQRLVVSGDATCR